jgi:hypothetical protein
MTASRETDTAQTRTHAPAEQNGAGAPPAPDLGRAIQRMYPGLARVAVAVSRLHRLRTRKPARDPRLWDDAR